MAPNDAIQKVLKILISILVLAYVGLILAGKIPPQAKLGWPELSLVGFVVIVAGGFLDRLGRVSFGEKGLEFDLNAVVSRQNAQESELTAIKVALRGLVTRYEYNHLARLN